MRSALFISPHLDDAVFSAGATAALLVARGWRVTIATVFTHAPHPATGFALACQRDKGLADDVDYMALRRAEDAAAARILGARALWLGLPEAPHRGYQSAAALFGPHLPGDKIAQDIRGALRDAISACVPDLLLTAAAIGAHVDHRVVLDAILRLDVGMPTAFWHDTPYVIRSAHAPADPRLSPFERLVVPVGRHLVPKLGAASAYGSQIGLQFGGAAPMRDALRGLAERDGGECFMATPRAADALSHLPIEMIAADASS